VSRKTSGRLSNLSGNDRLGPAALDEALRLVDAARRGETLNLSTQGLLGRELRNPLPHFKIGRTHIFVEHDTGRFLDELLNH
jgi:hypothetical protein